MGSISTENGPKLVEFNVVSVYGREAIGGYLLRFSVNYSVTCSDKFTGQFQNSLLLVHFGPKKLFLGVAAPEQDKIFRPTSFPESQGLLYETLISTAAFEEVERLRAGSDFSFAMSMRGQVVDSNGNVYPASTELTYHVTQSEWARVMKGANYRGSILFVYPMDIEASEQLRAAQDAVARAQELLYWGNYDDVVANCRKALDVVTPEPGSRAGLLRKAVDDHKAMPKNDRFFVAVEGVSKFTHLAHHLDSEGEYVAYSRAEALFVLGATVAALSAYSAWLSAKARSKAGAETPDASELGRAEDQAGQSHGRGVEP